MKSISACFANIEDIYYMPARGNEFYLRVLNSISQSFAALPREMSC